MRFMQQLAADACPAARSLHCAHQTLPALGDLLSAPAAPYSPIDAATVRCAALLCSHHYSLIDHSSVAPSVCVTCNTRRHTTQSKTVRL